MFVDSDEAHTKTNQVADTELNDIEMMMKMADEKSASQTEPPHIVDDFFETLTPKTKRTVGIVITMLAGLLYGIAFIPVVLQGQYEDNDNFLDYFHSYYSGIFLGSLFYLVLYCMVRKNEPVVIQNLFLPGFASAFVWSIGDVFYFLASGVLPQSIGYPISSIGPPVVSTLWGVFVYKEIKGVKNYVCLTLGMVLAIVASILIGLSS
jgi:hypothetical protein